MTDYSKIAEDFLLEQSRVRGSIPKIEKATGIPKAWLYKIAQGKISNPQVNRVMKLINYKDTLHRQDAA